MSSNATCHTKTAAQNSPPLFQNGNLVFQAHDVGWIVAGLFTICATITSFWLVNKHLQWYTDKREQRYIVRILLLVPIYANVSMASYLFWNQATPLLLIRDCYESTVLTSFFYLLLMYISHDPDEQKEVFRQVGLSRENDAEARKAGVPEKKWAFPLSFVKAKPEDGLYFLQMMKWGVLQYCIVRPATTLAAVVLDYAGLYCEDSWSPGWGHVYITIIVSVSVSIAMYCLIQLYVPIAPRLARHRPLLKLFAIKAVVFLTFWQASFLSVLSTFGVVKDTKYMTAEQINIGIGAILETFEMTLFAFLHVKAFSYKPYRPLDDTVARTPRLRALKHALDFRETARELAAALIYAVRRARGRETDSSAHRRAALVAAFGRSRAPAGVAARKDGKGAPAIEIAVAEEVDVRVGSERQWLGVGGDADCVYGLGYARREPSAGLADQIDAELEKRGFGSVAARQELLYAHEREKDEEAAEGHPRRRSWWRGLYERLSHTGYEDDADPSFTPPPRRRSWVRRHPSARPRYAPVDASAEAGAEADLPRIVQYGDLPPASIIRTYKATQPSATTPSVHEDVHAISPRSSSPRQASQSELLYTSAPVEMVRSDSVLGRVFPHAADSDVTSFSGYTMTNATSSQSHATHVRLAPPPTAVPTAQHGPARAPILVRPEHLADGSASEVFVKPPAAGVEGGRAALQRTNARRVSGTRQAVNWSLPLPPSPGHTHTIPLPSPSPVSRQFRPQIVLPMPLSPVRLSTVDGSAPGATTRQPTYSPPRVRHAPHPHPRASGAGNLSLTAQTADIVWTRVTAPDLNIAGIGAGRNPHYPRDSSRRSSAPVGALLSPDGASMALLRPSRPWSPDASRDSGLALSRRSAISPHRTYDRAPHSAAAGARSARRRSAPLTVFPIPELPVPSPLPHIPHIMTLHDFTNARR